MAKNNQITFDLMVNHLRKQGKRAMIVDSEGKLKCEMQITHDAVDPENWEEEFEKIARMYNLIYTPVQKEE